MESLHSVGDADDFRLYHTPGLGWRWPLKIRRVPTRRKGAVILLSVSYTPRNGYGGRVERSDDTCANRRRGRARGQYVSWTAPHAAHDSTVFS